MEQDLNFPNFPIIFKKLGDNDIGILVLPCLVIMYLAGHEKGQRPLPSFLKKKKKIQ